MEPNARSRSSAHRFSRLRHSHRHTFTQLPLAAAAACSFPRPCLSAAVNARVCEHGSLRRRKCANACFSQRWSPPPPITLVQLNRSSRHLAFVLCFRTWKVRLCTCVSCRRRVAWKKGLCQSLPPMGIVPLLLLVYLASGPRALRPPSRRMTRRLFPSPTPVRSGQRMGGAEAAPPPMCECRDSRFKAPR